AYELTKLIHGEEEALKAQEGASALFSKGVDTDNMPTTALSDADFTDDAISVLDLLTKCGLIGSKGEGKRLIQQGGISVDDAKVTDMFATIAKSQFEKGYVVVKKGKKVHHKATL
ncbi:MAG: tyrosine--tRNA ligase, partial [Ruminococcus sp.]|nr:tyrosine--tRNA ligase [Ruminococcus sp.]